MRNLLRIVLVGFCWLVSTQVNAQSHSDSTEVSEIVVFTTRGINASGARYHIDGCRYLKNGQIHIDERIALQRGLLPCSVCLPERTSDLPFKTAVFLKPLHAIGIQYFAPNIGVIAC